MIREFKENDLNSIMKLWLATNIAVHYFIDESYWTSNYELVKQMLPQATIYVSEEEVSINGFIGLNESYIAGIFVKAECQSKGIGKDLLNYVKERNEELFLQVYKKNTRAISFYQREGFVNDKEQIDKNTNEVEFVMRWRR